MSIPVRGCARVPLVAFGWRVPGGRPHPKQVPPVLELCYCTICTCATLCPSYKRAVHVCTVQVRHTVSTG